jgi:hypothetical protein
MLSSQDEDTLTRLRADTLPPTNNLGDLLVVTTDPIFQERARIALRDAGWRTTVTESTTLVGNALITSDVILLDPRGQRRTLERTLDNIARIRLRPSVILALRRREDLAVAVRRCIGCVDIDVSDDILQDAVLRTHRAQRNPRPR